MSESTAESSPIAWFQPRLEDSTLELIGAVLSSGYVNDGPRSRELEGLVAACIGDPFAVVTTSGTVAIALALLGSGVQPGDEVIVPALTFIGSATAIRLIGATPVLADVSEHDLNIDPESARSRVTTRTRAVLAVHLNGRIADIAAIRKAVGPNVVVIEDAAEALGSRSAQGFAGTIGEAGATSFAPTKLLTTGQGGMVFTRDPELHRRIVRWKDQGRDERDSMVHHALGFNFKFTDIQAALGIPQAHDLPRRLSRQVEIHRRYEAGLRDVPGLELPHVDLEGGAVPLWTDVLTDRRDELIHHMETHGVSPRRFWPPLHLHPPFSDERSYPVAERLCERGLWLPGGPNITDEQVDQAISIIRAFDGSGGT